MLLELVALLVATLTVGDALSSTRPSVADCESRLFSQKLDHWGFADSAKSYPLMFQQRYFVCYPRGVTVSTAENIFFYTGNEANVELYVNLTGFMWENAATFNAVLVFAEHRYFGESLPFPGEPMPTGDKLKFLNTDQALADYAELIAALRADVPSAHQLVPQMAAVIGFGGSYGGMLCTWLRSKYPSALDGCIAGSAPVIQFTGMQPPVDFDGFGKIMTFDASEAGGAKSDNCKANINAAFMFMQSAMSTSSAWPAMQADLGLCNPLQSPADVSNAMGAFANVIGFYTMGSYPYPSSYMMMGGSGELPAYPMRVVCDSFLSGSFTSSSQLLGNFSAAMKLYYDTAAGSSLKCINLAADGNRATQIVDYLWGYLSCTTMVLPSSYNGQLSAGGDMLYSAPWNAAQVTAGCVASYGVVPDFYWGKVGYGGRQVANTATNIVFTNGELDPWRAGGITPSSNLTSTIALIVSNAGHHMDLMFSAPEDSATNVRQVREVELQHIATWISKRKQRVL